MIPENEYPRLLRSCRISATLLVLSYGLAVLASLYKIGTYTTMFESLGDATTLPAVTMAVIQLKLPLAAGFSLCSLLCLRLIWKSLMISRVISVTTATVACFIAGAKIVDWAIELPLLKLFAAAQG